MRIIITLLSAYLLVSCFCSCNNKAAAFNNKLVNIQKSVLKEVQVFGKEMRKVNPGSLPATVNEEAKRIHSFIIDKINKVDNLLVPKEGGNFKEAILKQLRFERDLVENIGRLARPDISKDEKIQIQARLLSSRIKAKELENNVRVAQEAFATKNNIKLENK